MAGTVPTPAAFDGEIARYNRWREDLTRSVTAYHDWLESNGQLDVQQSIRFYDLLENLGKGRLMLAFLAEFSRGKSELINALFFSSFKERLLPSDVGRTTMCPTEIFHDPNEEPYLKLLSVETRYRDESISQLKNNPVEWSKVRLNTASAADMKKALSALADTKKVYALEARMLGLAPMLNEKGEMPGEEELIEVPAWRYAMINYPHPLLSNGLSILDTPGLNALGMEPELTVSTVPSAHAILFLLSIDTGVTKSDLEIWDRYVKPGLPQKIAVLNKIDLMWDELKSPEEIDRAVQRMVETTGKALSLDPSRIFPLSAQKALLGKVREDAGLIRKSGIEALEGYLAREIVPMRRQILCKAVMNEIGAMMLASRASVAHKQKANVAAMAELQGLVGKSRDVVTKLWAKITAEKNAYNSALAEYKVNQSTFNAKRSGLMDMLNAAKLDQMLASSAQAMEDSWTTVGLQRAMRELSKLMSADFVQVFAASEDIKKLMQGVYNTFTEKFGFQKMKLPALDFETHNMRLQLLVHETEAFSRDPVNVAHYKGPMVRKFHGSLVAQARGLFVDARQQSERWSQAVVMPLETQMKDHKAQLQARLDNLSKINEKSSGIHEQLAALKKEGEELARQRQMIDNLLQRVSREEAVASGAHEPADKPGTATETRTPPEMMQTLKLSAFDAPMTISRRAAQAQEVFKQVAPVKVEPEPRRPEPVAVPARAAKPAAAPLISSDDLMAGLAAVLSPEGVPTLPGAEPPAAPRVVAAGALSGADQDPVTTVNQRTLARAEANEPAADTPTIDYRAREGERTVQIPAFNPARFNADGSPKEETAAHERTQKIDLNALAKAASEQTQRLDPALAQRLDPTTTQPFNPERTQRMQAEPPPAGKPAEGDGAAAAEPTRTQRLDASIQKLQEAKRLLQGVTQKP